MIISVMSENSFLHRSTSFQDSNFLVNNLFPSLNNNSIFSTPEENNSNSSLSGQSEISSSEIELFAENSIEPIWDLFPEKRSPKRKTHLRRKRL